VKNKAKNRLVRLDSEDCGFNLRLAQEGCAAAMKAAKKFDPTRGAICTHVGNHVRCRMVSVLAPEGKVLAPLISFHQPRDAADDEATTRDDPVHNKHNIPPGQSAVESSQTELLRGGVAWDLRVVATEVWF
jgi:hypothetical protein